MKNHTPGPWLAVDTRDNDIDGWQGAFGILAEKQPIGVHCNDICTVWNRAGTKRTNANAALIASAPEMLEALERIVSDAEKFYSEHNVEEPSECILIARSVIAKATGEQP